MAEGFASIPGSLIQPTDLRLPRAVAFVRALQESALDEIVECRNASEGGNYLEIVVADVGVGRPQKTVHDIRLTERIAGRFAQHDARPPDVLALRIDFPLVPHLNLIDVEYPKSLCLYADEWSSQKLRWNGKAFLERIREWLRLTARGELHQNDQPLEPLMFGSGYRVVLPHQWLETSDSAPQPLDLALHAAYTREQILIASDPNRNKDVRPEQQYLMVRVVSPPVTHGVIRKSPTNLGELAGFTDRNGFSLVSKLRERLKELSGGPQRDRRFVLLVDFPKSRQAEGKVEHIERRAFLTTDSVAAVGEKLGVWARHGSSMGVIIGDAAPGDATAIQIDAVINVTATCTWDLLARLNGGAGRNTIKIAAVGAGALGSQVMCNLARRGLGEWTIIDVDTFLPHNAARHALNARLTGISKASAIAWEMNGLAPDDSPIARALVADVLLPRDQSNELAAAVRDAELLLDFSASVPVARTLSSTPRTARAASLFLSPSGSDFVAMIEDGGRSCPLNDLEMTYYWAAATHPDLQHHLAEDADLGELARPRVRYGASCRDVSSQIRHDFVALHAANAATTIGRLVAASEASLQIYQYEAASGSLHPVVVPVEPLHSCKIAEWEIRIAPAVLREVLRSRQNALPNETGGVLLGGADFERSTIYVVGVLDAPGDSEQLPNGFIRGSKRLAERLAEIERRTLENISYLGEWHSHPDGTGTMPSAADTKLLGWIQEKTVPDGRPAVMIIGGQHGECRVIVGSDSQHITMKCTVT